MLTGGRITGIFCTSVTLVVVWSCIITVLPSWPHGWSVTVAVVVVVVLRSGVLVVVISGSGVVMVGGRLLMVVMMVVVVVVRVHGFEVTTGDLFYLDAEPTTGPEGIRMKE